MATGIDMLRPILIENRLSRGSGDKNMPELIDIGPLVAVAASMEHSRSVAIASNKPTAALQPTTAAIATKSAESQRTQVSPESTHSLRKVVIANKVEVTTVIDYDDDNDESEEGAADRDQLDRFASIVDSAGVGLIAMAAASAAAGEMYFNVPAGVDRSAVQAAFLDRGIQGYDPVARPNANGLYPAAGAKSQPAIVQNGPQQLAQPPQQPPQQAAQLGPQQPPQQMLQQAPQQQQPQAPRQQPQAPQPPSPGKPVSVPLAPARGPGGVGLQSVESSEAKPAATSAVPVAAMVAAPPHNVLTSTVVAMSTVTGVVPATKPVPGRAVVAEEEEVVEEEEIEDDDDASDADSPSDGPAPRLVPPTSSTTTMPAAVVAAPTEAAVASAATAATGAAATGAAQPLSREKPLMLAKAGVTAFKPADLDKFTFPSSEAAVNMAGPAAAASSSASAQSPSASAQAAVHTSSMRAAPATSSASGHASSATAASKAAKVKSLTMGNGMLSKHAENSAESADSGAGRNSAASLVALAALAVLF
ncbi:hypothetical protein H4R23_000127 [Coemansia sp. Cherry 401B]|nr:hypothetical protein H4R23_000127 [Coemansia sp. Cherry 401B]